jgi:hypothetical protein
MGRKKDTAKRILFKSDFRRATVLGTIPSLLLDFLFIGVNFVLGVYLLSLWNMVLCIYYVMLTLLRLNVLGRSAKAVFSKDKVKAYIKLYRSTHRMLFVLDIMLAGAIYILLDNYIWKSYPGVAIYFVAVYTVYKVAASVINLFRAHRVRSVTTILLRKIGYADALVSLLILESAIIGRSGYSRSYDSLQFATISGLAVCAVILVISLQGMFKPKAKIADAVNKSDPEV